MSKYFKFINLYEKSMALLLVPISWTAAKNRSWWPSPDTIFSLFEIKRKWWPWHVCRPAHWPKPEWEKKSSPSWKIKRSPVFINYYYNREFILKFKLEFKPWVILISGCWLRKWGRTWSITPCQLQNGQEHVDRPAQISSWAPLSVRL